jgi:hypothetical protein
MPLKVRTDYTCLGSHTDFSVSIVWTVLGAREQATRSAETMGLNVIASNGSGRMVTKMAMAYFEILFTVLVDTDRSHDKSD